MEDYREPRSKWFGIASLCIGLIGLLCWLVALCGVVTGILGLVLGIFGLRSETRVVSMIGIGLNGLVLVLALVNMGYGAYVMTSGQGPFWAPDQRMPQLFPTPVPAGPTPEGPTSDLDPAEPTLIEPNWDPSEPAPTEVESETP